MRECLALRPERMNAFTDGVIAILITILVLELRPPSGDRLSDVLDEKGKLLAYVLSFVFVAIYWVNHHHLMQVVYRIDGRTLWANIHLLFWLSLTPVTTAWLGDAGVKSGPAAAYGIVLLGCGMAYTLLTLALLALHETSSQLARAIGTDRKGRLSLVLYVVALVCAFVVPWVSIALFVTVAVIWVIPDRRVARVLGEDVP
jgi:TMEM175 potassium channel family protein